MTILSCLHCAILRGNLIIRTHIAVSQLATTSWASENSADAARDCKELAANVKEVAGGQAELKSILAEQASFLLAFTD